VIGLKNTYQDVANRLAKGLESGEIVLHEDSNEFDLPIMVALWAWLTGTERPIPPVPSAPSVAPEGPPKSGEVDEIQKELHHGLMAFRLPSYWTTISDRRVVIGVPKNAYDSMKPEEKIEFKNRVEILRERFPGIDIRTINDQF
jgi:hypothetical protein